MAEVPGAARYPFAARLLHAVVAALVAALIVIGIAMVRTPLSIERMFDLYQWHKSLGVALAIIMFARVFVRLRAPPPPHPETVPLRQRRFARFVQHAFYAVLFALPLTGWLMVSAAPLWFPISLGTIEMPPLRLLQTMPDAERAQWFAVLQRFHTALAVTLAALVAVHVAGALLHGRPILRRMRPW